VLGIGFVPLRKKGRLPYRTESARYSLEYGEAEMELHIDAIERGEKIVLIDDLLATGGTSASAATLIKKVGGDLIEAILPDRAGVSCAGARKLESTPVTSFLKY
jgi:adenine phosphoribosyltransferase